MAYSIRKVTGFATRKTVVKGLPTMSALMQECIFYGITEEDIRGGKHWRVFDGKRRMTSDQFKGLGLQVR